MGNVFIHQEFITLILVGHDWLTFIFFSFWLTFVGKKFVSLRFELLSTTLQLTAKLVQELKNVTDKTLPFFEIAAFQQFL